MTSKFKDMAKYRPGSNSNSGSGSGSGSGTGSMTGMGIRRKAKGEQSITGIGIRGKASGMMGHGNPNEPKNDHVARPLGSLADPTSFAPPPKRSGASLAPPPPRSEAKRSVVAAPSKWQDPKGPKVEPPPRVTQDPALDEHFAGTSSPERALARTSVAEEEEAQAQPWRLNTSGMQADHFAPPPGRRDGADGRGPPSYEAAVTSPPVAPPRQIGGSATPGLPPRLPSRTSAGSPAHASPPLPARTNSASSAGMLNQGAINRLGAAGVSVPSLGIRGHSPVNTSSPGPPPPPPSRSTAASPITTSSANAQMNELQGRFGRLGTSSNTTAPTPPAQGTTWAQKQAALKTASSFQKDPSSVSFSDAKTAASTANNFRQRHGEQVSAGMKSANGLSQKYGIADRVGGLAGQQNAAPAPVASPVGPSPTSTMAAAAAGKKKPPPPPKKKPGLSGSVPPSPAGDDLPPPIPSSTRPAY